MTQCIDCGKETSGGLRCRACHGKFIKEFHAVALMESDRALLKMRDEEHLSGARIAARIGISRDRAYKRIIDARRREETRMMMPDLV